MQQLWKLCATIGKWSFTTLRKSVHSRFWLVSRFELVMSHLNPCVSDIFPVKTFWWNLKLKNSQIKILWCWSWMVVIALCGCNGRYFSSTSTIFNSWHKLDKMTNFAQNALRRIEKLMENSVASAVIWIYYSKRLIGFLWWLVLPSQCWVWIFVAEEECNHFVAFSN